MKRLLYVGCLGYGNAGDEACWTASRSLLAEALPADWQVDFIDGYAFTANEPFDALVLGGGTLLSPWGNLGDSALQESARRGTPAAVFCSGLESVEWEGPAPDAMRTALVEMLAATTLIGVRGPLSRDYLVSLGVPEQRVEVVGDPAVALEPVASPVAMAATGARWIGVNVGTSRGEIFGGDEDAVVEEAADALTSAASAGWGALLFPVWKEDLALQAELAARLDGRMRLHVVDDVLPAESLIHLLSQVEVAVAMKLHAGIFAATAGTPYLPWAYRPKVEDFAHAVSMADLVVRTDAPRGALSERLGALTADLPMVRVRLRDQVEAMRGRLEEFAARVGSAVSGARSRA